MPIRRDANISHLFISLATQRSMGEEFLVIWARIIHIQHITHVVLSRPTMHHTYRHSLHDQEKNHELYATLLINIQMSCGVHISLNINPIPELQFNVYRCV